MKILKHTEGQWDACRFGIEIKPGDEGHEILATVNGVQGVHIATIPIAGKFGMMRPHPSGKGSEEYASYTISKKESLANLRLLTAAPRLQMAVRAMCIAQELGELSSEAYEFARLVLRESE